MPRATPADLSSTQSAAVEIAPFVRIDPNETARAGETRADNALQLPFCYCPAGSSLMGSPRDARWHSNDEGPARDDDQRLLAGPA
jgi:hypothetical protein